MNTTQAQLGDRRLVVYRPGGPKDCYLDSLVSESRVDNTFPDDLLRAALAGKPPWWHASVQIYRGSFLGWETLSSARRTPKPGWAHPKATYCKTCGEVAFDGAALPCGHV